MTMRSNKIRFIALLFVMMTITSVGFPTIQARPDSRSLRDRNPNETKLARIQAASNLIMPMIFEINRGQADDDVRFIGRSAGFGILLKSNEAVLSLNSSAQSILAADREVERGKPIISKLHMRLEGAAHNA